MTARKYLFAAVLLLAAFAASAQERSLDVIPYPNHVEYRDGNCNVAKARLKFKVVYILLHPHYFLYYYPL